VNGFAGFVDTGEHLRFTPRLPETWTSMTFRLRRHGSDIRVSVDAEGATVTVTGGAPVPIKTADGLEMVEAGGSVLIPRTHA
jgi:alpha,alpha-trehalose phosphorylase